MNWKRDVYTKCNSMLFFYQDFCSGLLSMRKRWSFPLRISSVNMTKSVRNFSWSECSDFFSFLSTFYEHEELSDNTDSVRLFLKLSSLVFNLWVENLTARKCQHKKALIAARKNTNFAMKMNHLHLVSSPCIFSCVFHNICYRFEDILVFHNKWKL